jgi:hypothetical protein
MLTASGLAPLRSVLDLAVREPWNVIPVLVAMELAASRATRNIVVTVPPALPRRLNIAYDNAAYDP